MIGLFLGITLMACSLDGKCNEMEFLKQNKEKIEQVKKDFQWLKEKQKDVSDFEKLLPSRQKIEEVRNKYENLTRFDENLIRQFEGAILTKEGQKRIWEMFFKKDLPSNQKVKVIFYLFSRSVPKKTVENVFKSAEKLTGYRFCGVLRGIDKKTISYLASIESFKKGKITVKINPLIFEKAGTSVVPVFVLAECREDFGVLRTKNCSFKAALYGDVSLEFALKKFEEVEKK